MSPAGQLPLSGVSILVVDDEEDLRELLSDLFESEGATVKSGKSGKEAFEVFKSGEFDIVFSDVRMPGGDGVSLFTSIHSHLQNSPQQKKPKLFFCSGFNDLKEEQVKALGVLRVFTKPFRMDEVIKTLVASLAR